MKDKRTKIKNNTKIIAIISAFIVSVIILFTFLSFIPIMGETILFGDVDVIDFGEIVIFCSLFVGIPLILILIIFKKKKNTQNI